MASLKREPFWLCLFLLSLVILYFKATTKENQQYVYFQDYSQKVISLKEKLKNDKYLEELYNRSRILEFNDGSIEIISNPWVGYPK